MYKVLAVNHEVNLESCDYTFITESELYSCSVESYDYVIVTGGDGLLRRVVSWIHRTIPHSDTSPVVLLNPKGTSNIYRKFHNCASIQQFQSYLKGTTSIKVKACPYYSLNDEIFLFSAGNSFDLACIKLSEKLRPFLSGFSRYFCSGMIITPILFYYLAKQLLNSNIFFIFKLPFRQLKGRTIPQNGAVDFQLDGDIVHIPNSEQLKIEEKGTFLLMTEF